MKSIRFMDELFYLCKLSGFNTLSEINEYIKREGITLEELYWELDALNFPKFISMEL